MKKITIMQAAKYAEHCNDMVRDAPFCADRNYAVSALIYMCRWSKNAREIVGAAKLLRVVDTIRARCISFEDECIALHLQDIDKIKNIFLENPKSIKFEEDKDE